MSLYALRTRPLSEMKAKDMLEAMGIRAEVPTVEVKRRAHRRWKVRKTKKIPAMRGYLFARHDGAPPWHIIAQCWLVRPLPVLPYEPIQETDAARLTALEEAPAGPQGYAIGDRVKVTSGPLMWTEFTVAEIKGERALWDGPSKIWLMLDTLERIA